MLKKTIEKLSINFSIEGIQGMKTNQPFSKVNGSYTIGKQGYSYNLVVSYNELKPSYSFTSPSVTKSPYTDAVVHALFTETAITPKIKSFLQTSFPGKKITVETAKSGTIQGMKTKQPSATATGKFSADSKGYKYSVTVLYNENEAKYIFTNLQTIKDNYTPSEVQDFFTKDVLKPQLTAMLIQHIDSSSINSLKFKVGEIKGEDTNQPSVTVDGSFAANEIGYTFKITLEYNESKLTYTALNTVATPISTDSIGANWNSATHAYIIKHFSSYNPNYIPYPNVPNAPLPTFEVKLNDAPIVSTFYNTSADDNGIHQMINYTFFGSTTIRKEADKQSIYVQVIVDTTAKTSSINNIFDPFNVSNNTDNGNTNSQVSNRLQKTFTDDLFEKQPTSFGCTNPDMEIMNQDSDSDKSEIQKYDVYGTYTAKWTNRIQIKDDIQIKNNNYHFLMSFNPQTFNVTIDTPSIDPSNQLLLNPIAVRKVMANYLLNLPGGRQKLTEANIEFIKFSKKGDPNFRDPARLTIIGESTNWSDKKLNIFTATVSVNWDENNNTISVDKFQSYDPTNPSTNTVWLQNFKTQLKLEAAFKKIVKTDSIKSIEISKISNQSFFDCIKSSSNGNSTYTAWIDITITTSKMVDKKEVDTTTILKSVKFKYVLDTNEFKFTFSDSEPTV